MLLYHGSNLSVPAPRLVSQTRGLDFGAGFYLTANEGQARSFSRIIVNRRKTGTATVSMYEFDMELAIQSLNNKIFKETNKEWLDFVKDNRLNPRESNE